MSPDPLAVRAFMARIVYVALLAAYAVGCGASLAVYWSTP